MFAYAVVRWGMPVITLPIAVMMIGLIVGAAFPGFIFAITGAINAFFAILFDLLLWFYPVQAVLVDKNGYEEVFHEDPGLIYHTLRDFLTSLPERGNYAVGTAIGVLCAFELTAFIYLVFRSGGKPLNNDTSAISAESMDGSWVMGKGKSSKKK